MALIIHTFFTLFCVKLATEQNSHFWLLWVQHLEDEINWTHGTALMRTLRLCFILIYTFSTKFWWMQSEFFARYHDKKNLIITGFRIPTLGVGAILQWPFISPSIHLFLLSNNYFHHSFLLLRWLNRMFDEQLDSDELLCVSTFSNTYTLFTLYYPTLWIFIFFCMSSISAHFTYTTE